MINSVCGIRSTGRICTDLAVELERQGHEVKIAYGRENVTAEFERFAVKIGTDLDVKLHGIKARVFDAMGFGSAEATKVFIHWLKKYDPDIIHLHNIHGYYINIEILFEYLKTCGKKIIWTLHDCWAFTGHSAYCDAIDCTSWKTGCHDCPQKNVYPKSLTDNSKNNWLKKKEIFTGIPDFTIITPSNWLKGLVQKSFFKDYPVEVIHNGIDTNVFKPTESDFREKYNLQNRFALLGVATSWDEMKGLNDYILLSKLLSEDYQIVLVGLSSKKFRTLPKNIIGIQRTSNIKELAEIYSACDVLLNLTYCDTYPTVNLEALACGTPVVTYDTGGSPEAIGDNGIVTEKGNMRDLLIAIEKLCSEPKELISNMRLYDKVTAIKQYITIYNK